MRSKYTLVIEPTPKEHTVLEMYEARVKISEIGKTVGLSVASVSRIARKFGMKRYKAVGNHLEGKVRALAKQGAAPCQISKRLRVSRRRVSHIIDYYQHPKRYPKSINQHTKATLPTL